MVCTVHMLAEVLENGETNFNLTVKSSVRPCRKTNELRPHNRRVHEIKAAGLLVEAYSGDWLYLRFASHVRQYHVRQ